MFAFTARSVTVTSAMHHKVLSREVHALCLVVIANANDLPFIKECSKCFRMPIFHRIRTSAQTSVMVAEHHLDMATSKLNI